MKNGAHVGFAGVNYRVWAPGQKRLRVRIRRRNGAEVAALTLEPAGDGAFIRWDPDGHEGDRYQFELADGTLLPDPASRFQPEGVHGPSECIDPRRYRWRCPDWRRPAWGSLAIYELHVGTFTPQGTFRAAIEHLDHVRRLGVDVIELMPLADFAGDRNWGYDGVALYAPARCYGRPDDLRALVDGAHEKGLAVILDVVYNHTGPDGSALSRLSSSYFNGEHQTPWGAGFNFDGPGREAVREFFVGNAAYWLDEFRFDGLRLDATHAIRDDSPRHVLAEIAAAAHERGAFVIAEDERNDARLVAPESEGGLGLDAAWSDDFHHQMRVALTGSRHSYFSSYSGSAPDLAQTLAEGWYYHGQIFPFWKDRPRGTPGGHLPSRAFILCLENHDQTGNRAEGERLEHLIDPAVYRAASLLLCLSPYPILLFMGQEWSASTPFLYFTDHEGELGKQITAGRRREFPEHADGGASAPDPQDPATFENSKLLWPEVAAGGHATVLDLYRACLRERASWVPGASARERWEVRAIDGLISLRYRPTGGRERLVLAALREGAAAPRWTSEPMLQPPPGQSWSTRLVSQEPGTRPARPGPEAIDFTHPAAALFEATPV